MDSMPDLDRPPSRFVQATGLVLDDVQSSHVTGWMNLGPDHHQPWGLVHGGVYTTAIESAASVGASTAAREHGLGASSAGRAFEAVTAPAADSERTQPATA